MEYFIAIFEGIIQGATEFLPVSSSGHLSLFYHFTGTEGEEAIFSSITLHLGTLIAVFIAFRKKIGELIKEFFAICADFIKGKFVWSEMNGNRRMIVMIVVSILPLFIFYVFKDFFLDVSKDRDICAEGICFLYTAAILTLGDRCAASNLKKGTAKTAGETDFYDALFIGFMQGVALLPGVSRSGSTIAAGLISGQKKEDAVEYSFILGIPVILASALSEFIEVGKGGGGLFEPAPLIAGMAAAAVAGYFAISLIKWLVKSDKFRIFAVYTFVLGVAVIGLGAYEHITNTWIHFGK